MDLTELSAVELSKRIRRREISCREVMAKYLERIDVYNPAHNAIVNLRPARDILAEATKRDEQLSRGEHLGWMHGLPQAVKDLWWVEGLPATSGSKLFEHFVPARDSLHVERVKAAGAIIIGKTNTPEFGLGSNTYNSVFGATRNALDPSRSAGGSSGGAAVAVALRLLPVADGSDVMGSLRNPAAFNGVIGMRPSIGRVPTVPGIELFFQQIGTLGPMGRTVADIAQLLATMSGYHPEAPLSLGEPTEALSGQLDSDLQGLRIGWLGDLGGHLPFEHGVLSICQAAAERMRELGCSVEDVTIAFDQERLWRAWLLLRQWLVSNRLKDLYMDPSKRAELKPEAIWEIEHGMTLTASEVYDASLVRSDWYRMMLTTFGRFDFLVLPAAQVFPYDVDQPWPAEIDGRRMDTYHRWMEVVVGPTMAGLPVIAMPAGLSESGQPAGIQIIAPPRADLPLLRFAKAYERVSEKAAMTTANRSGT